MLTYIFRRVLYSVPVLIVVSFITFWGIRLAFDPLAKFRGQHNSAQIIPIQRKRLGLDKPIPYQWFKWFVRALHGDLGVSDSSNNHVFGELIHRLGTTMHLIFWGTLVAALLAVGIGVYSAVKQYSVGDYAFTGLSYIGIAMPPFWFGLMAIVLLVTWPKTQFNLDHPIFYSIGLHSTGESGIFNLDYYRHLALPVATLVVQSVASWSRYQRASMLDVLGADYIRTARAKGVPRRRVIFKHAFRNALIPLVTVMALDTAYLFGGLVITEKIFAISGMGAYFIDALNHGDAPALLGWTLFIAVIVITFNLIADVLYGVLDPRIRLG
jgi:peptide/nickel transport system permease protein